MLQNTFTWLDEHYDKIAVEEAIQSDPAVPWTILRLPMVYGPGDPLHRFFPLLKRVADARSSILFSEDLAAWRGAARICGERCACDCGRRNIGSGSRTHLQHL
jgi:nucleoside-diphosphate-sugar epimerase